MSKLDELLNMLDSYKDSLSDKSYYMLYDLGKELDYKERVVYDYKLDCIRDKSSFSEVMAMVCHENKMVDKLVRNNEFEYILSNIEQMIRSKDTLNPVLLEYLKKYEDAIPFGIMETINDTIVHTMSSYYPHVKDEDMERLKHVIIVNCCNEGKSLLDVRYFDYGGYTSLFSLGDKLIKISFKRVCHKIPFNDRLLLPYFKGSIGADYVEITDYIDRNINEVHDKEELYEVYKELRDQGINWIDASMDNILRIPKKILDRQSTKKYLIKQNDIVSNPNYIKNELSPGDVVIIDLDHMVFDYEIDKIEDIKEELNPLRIQSVGYLEDRYLKEKEQVKVKKIGN